MLKSEKQKTETEQKLFDLVKQMRAGEYKSFVWVLARRLEKVVELKNPLTGSILVGDIEKIIEIINPKLKIELNWFKEVQSVLKLWCNEKIIANRLLGLKNDNEYDMRVFQKVVVEKFWMQLSGRPLKPDTPVQTDFQTMVELVEIGARRFGD